ncbi:MAG: hypothetical protein C4531_06985 [Desulfurivibrio sp.]|nr:MAG: hypothetical protein C4531_06985 [Desulfurivibrio sp.]
MSSGKYPCISHLFAAGLALCCAAVPAGAGQERPALTAAGAAGDAGQQEPAVYYETEGDYYLGYRWLSDEDSLKAAEYIYPHSSVTLGLDLVSCPLPYRYHVNAEYLSNYDYYTDAGFAYKDLVLFRDILVGVHHNLDHSNYQYAGEPPELIYTDRNAWDDYYVDFVSNLLSLRLKAPDFPLHTFVNQRHVEREGKVEQRFLLGDFNEIHKVSEARDVDWNSNALKLGANSHLGPVEVEYAYDQADFDPNGNDILHDAYPASVDFARPGDSYPHNVVPETESAAHSVKMHSSYTGGLVAAATLSSLNEKNNYSGTESTTWKGAFDFSWIPDPAVGLFFKYRHKDVDLDTPGSTTLTGLVNTLNYPVRQGISYDKDVFSLSSRYRPGKLVTLFATYEFSHLDRQDVDAWLVLPGQSNTHTINLTANARPLDKVKVTAGYEYKNFSQPAYNLTPDSSNKLRLTSTWMPLAWLNVYLEYILSLTERNSLNYLNSEPAVLLEIGERDGRHDQFLASLTSELSARASLTGSWFYQRWDVEQDLAYGKWLTAGAGDLPYLDAAVPYTDEANSFSLSLFYLLRPDLSLTADVTYTITRGKTDYDGVVGGESFSLDSFSALKASETVCSLELAKRLSKEWEVRLRSYVDVYNDREYDLLDGNVFTTIFSIKRYF